MNAVAVEERVYRYEDEVARQRLGDEHSVKWIAMKPRQRAGACSLFNGDWQFHEVLFGYCPGDVEDQRLRAREFAKADAWWRSPRPILR